MINPIIGFIAGIIATSVILGLEKMNLRVVGESWGFAKEIMPLLGAGVLVAVFTGVTGKSERNNSK
jgi:hypothetical protein